KLYFDNELIDTWAVVKLNMIHVSLKNLQTLNERSEKEFFKEDWFYGIKDRESLLSMLGSVDNGYFNFIPYPTVITKAAYFWYTIATKQMFHNGNKRTALLTAMFYLQMNGLEFKVKDKESLYNISLSLAKKEMTEKQLVDYISKNVLIDFNWMSYVWERITKEK
ncbi:type II toxin-antitoxin system death-on-curing family toxin, partial [Liquorilactobacillus satsumensis]